VLKLKIQEFINCFNNTSEGYVFLKRNLNIDCVTNFDDPEHPIFLLKPGQRADMTNPLVREAHCLMLDSEGDIMAKSWDHPVIVDKADELPRYFSLTGSICEEVPDGETIVIYNIEGKWCIGTTDSVDGDVYLPGMTLPGFTFEHEVKKLLVRRLNTGNWRGSFSTVNPFLCFTFKFVSPYADRVMPIVMPELYMTGIVNLETGEEMSVDMVEHMANKMSLPRPNRSEINGNTSLTNRLLNMRALAPGLMLRDKNDHRIFIPNPIYKAVKHAKEAGDRIKPIHAAKILQACRDRADITTITTVYGNLKPMLELLHSERNTLLTELIMLWNAAMREKSLKDFATLVQHHPLNYLIFMRRDNPPINFGEEMRSINPGKLAGITKKRWEKEYDSASRLLKFTGDLTDGDSKEEEENGSIPFAQEGD